MSPSRNSLRPAIARIWRGRATAAKADEYAAGGLRPSLGGNSEQVGA